VMSKRRPRPESPNACAVESLRDRRWERFLRGPDRSLLEELYVPALSAAVRYDRCCAYFSSSVLSAAARGFGKLIEHLVAMGESAPRPAIRLLVNEELQAEDVRAMMETGDCARLESSLKKRFKKPQDALQQKRLTMLAWLVKSGLLEVRVGVMRGGHGILHAKFGIVTDANGDAVVFRGSGNESATGLQSNYEQLELGTSWGDTPAHKYFSDEFESLWYDAHPDVHTVRLPEAIRLQLVRLAPKEPPVIEPGLSLERQKAAMLWSFVAESPYLPEVGAATCDATAPVDLWPHQQRVVEEVSSAWPSGRLLCDEVGMGKTVEAIMVLRRLLAGRGVKRVLILLPKGLLNQWQEELREKGALLIPRLEGISTIVWPDGRTVKVPGLADALNEDALLMSRETARLEANLHILLEAQPWDLVVLDEAHAARRSKQEEGEFNSGNLLLELLRELQLQRRAKGILLLSATPMQTHAWEPWDLMAVLGEGGAWLGEFDNVRVYYRALERVNRGAIDRMTARRAAHLISQDPDFPTNPGLGDFDVRDEQSVTQALLHVKPSERALMSRWLRNGSPLSRRMHRNTRETLVGYHELGLLPSPPPKRIVRDERFDYTDPAEGRVYAAIGTYIKKRFEQLEEEKPGKGFVMTIYQRRLASSPLALQRSLERRRDGLLAVERKHAFDRTVSEEEGYDSRNTDELGPDDFPGEISTALPDNPKTAAAERAEVDSLLAELAALHGRDTKREVFLGQLKRVTDDGRAALVFTEYTDTLEYLRNYLVEKYGTGLGCYRGRGGQRWDGTEWKIVSKEEITKALHTGEIQILICTDAASEGLNLQTASALINYDLPWNPSRIEQRIGRIDRIGQQAREVLIVNLFLRGSIDDRVYQVLRARCGMFEHFVGHMQPVLSLARRMLLGRSLPDTKGLETAAGDLAQDMLSKESYKTSAAERSEAVNPAFRRDQWTGLLERLQTGDIVRFHRDEEAALWHVTEPRDLKISLSHKPSTLDANPKAQPLDATSEWVRRVAGRLGRDGERLPLVIASQASGAYRVSVALWVGRGKPIRVRSLDQLSQLVEAWDGICPEEAEWKGALRQAIGVAAQEIASMQEHSAGVGGRMVSAQGHAARTRLIRELGKYLVSLDSPVADLNERFYGQLRRTDIESQVRLKSVFEHLGSEYPHWNDTLLEELRDFASQQTANEKKGRLIGSGLDAALQDPRWRIGANSSERQSSGFA